MRTRLTLILAVLLAATSAFADQIVARAKIRNNHVAEQFAPRFFNIGFKVLNTGVPNDAAVLTGIVSETATAVLGDTANDAVSMTVLDNGACDTKLLQVGGQFDGCSFVVSVKKSKASVPWTIPGTQTSGTATGSALLTVHDQTNPSPEPGTLTLLTAGLLALFWYRKSNLIKLHN